MDKETKKVLDDLDKQMDAERTIFQVAMKEGNYKHIYESMERHNRLFHRHQAIVDECREFGDTEARHRGVPK
jgi:hypothetical protein